MINMRVSRNVPGLRFETSASGRGSPLYLRKYNAPIRQRPFLKSGTRAETGDTVAHATGRLPRFLMTGTRVNKTINRAESRTLFIRVVTKRSGIFTDLHNPHCVSVQASALNTWRDRLQTDADESPTR